MSADDAEFEANWTAFVDRIAAPAAVHDAHMQDEVNKLIGK